VPGLLEGVEVDGRDGSGALLRQGDRDVRQRGGGRGRDEHHDESGGRDDPCHAATIPAYGVNLTVITSPSAIG
jgi:hypothetical protein